MEKVKFFTHYDPPSSDADSEHFEPGTSETVPDQVEPVSVTVARCLRGEVLASYEKPVYYEGQGCNSEDEMFSKFDETTSAGFDLADVPSLLDRAGANSVGEEREATKSSEPEKDLSSETKSNDDSNQSKE